MNKMLMVDEKYREGMAVLTKGVFRAQTSRECEEAMNASGLFKTECSLRGIPAHVGRQVGMAYFKLFLDLPFMAGRIDGVGVYNSRGGSLAHCHMYDCGGEFAGGAVHLNVYYYRDSRKMDLVYRQREGFFPEKTDYRAVITHELGHAVDGYLTGAGLAGKDKGGAKRSLSRYLKRRVLKALEMKAGAIGGAVSGYAGSSAAEWFAECFAEYMDSPMPRDMCKECIFQLKDMLRGAYYQGTADAVKGILRGGKRALRGWQRATGRVSLYESLPYYI